jgi:hypothetical protein
VICARPLVTFFKSHRKFRGNVLDGILIVTPVKTMAVVPVGVAAVIVVVVIVVSVWDLAFARGWEVVEVGVVIGATCGVKA